VKAQDGQLAKIEPAVVEISKPIIDGAVDHCNQIKLIA
jgi:hypothetical protein